MDARRYAGMVWPGAIVLLTGIYAYWASQRELVSSRPAAPGQYDVPDPLPTPGLATVHSRMWEDPLSTTYADWKRKYESGLRERESEDSSKAASLEEQAGRVISDSEFPAEPPDWVLEDYTDACCESSAEDPLPRFRGHFTGLLSSMETICLPVFLPGGPYAEMKEKRMRIRYSVATALAESGYYLQYSQRMSYFHPTIDVRTLRGWVKRDLVVPVKLYRSDKTKSQAIVMYINESEVGLRPLLTLHRILNRVFCEAKPGQQKMLQVAIIGPASSDMLGEMVEEIHHLASAKPQESDSIEWDRWMHWRIESYSRSKAKGSEAQVKLKPIAGYCPLLDPSVLNPADRPKSSRPRIPIFSSRATANMRSAWMEDVGENRFFECHRVIGVDRQLVKLLRGELLARGLDLERTVLITEHDTKYGREIQRTFQEEFSTTISTFKTLRGIDGLRPGDAKDVPKSSESVTSAETLREVYERLPSGRSQYDYLIRLHDDLRNLPDEFSPRPQAIGIVGSDIYDKLLVLRALRPQFPDCVFFTTDLDAIYQHPDERAHARNLLIASHFDLRLGRSLQRETAPFRDSYQTATFLATRLAITKSDRAIQESWRERLDHAAAELEDPATKSKGTRDTADDEDIATLKRMAQVLSCCDNVDQWVKTLRELKQLLADSSDRWPPETQQLTQSVIVDLDCRARCKQIFAQLEQDEGEIPPVLSVVGQDAIHRLQPRGTSDDPAMATASELSVGNQFLYGWIHPSTRLLSRGWSLFFVLLLLIGAALAVSFVAAGTQLRLRPLADGSLSEFPPDWPETTASWRRELQWGSAICLGIGLLILLFLLISSSVDDFGPTPFLALTSWTKNLLYVLAGIAAILMATTLFDQFVRVLHGRDKTSGQVVHYASQQFRATQIAKSLMIGIALFHTSIAILYGASWFTLLVSLGALAALYGLARYGKHLGERETEANATDQRSVDAGVDSILSADSGLFARFIAGALIVVTLLTWLLHAPQPDWYPRSLSATPLMRFIDRLVELYAISMLALFLAFLLGCHLYLVHFARGAKLHVGAAGKDSEALVLHREHERLWLIGKLTSVTSVFAPLALLQLFVLTVAYHPRISPTPMPIGLLILLSVSTLLFLMPALLIRWMMHRERVQLLAGFDSPVEADAEGQPEKNQLASPSGDVMFDGDHHLRQADPQHRVDGVEPGAGQRDAADETEAASSVRKRIENLSEGVFRPLSESPLGWIVGGGASLALIDLWVRSWAYGL